MLCYCRPNHRQTLRRTTITEQAATQDSTIIEHKAMGHSPSVQSNIA